MWQLTMVFPRLSVCGWPEHRGGSGNTAAAAVVAGGQRAEADDMLQNGGSGQRGMGGSLSGSFGAPCCGTEPESAPAAGVRNRGGAGDWGFFPDARARPHREVEADRWAVTARGAHKAVAQRGRASEAGSRCGSGAVNGSGPIELRNGFLNLDKSFPILHNRK
jgi:hypothetical protein